MYLSRLMLNPRSRWVQQDLADRYQLHKTVFSGFAETLPEDERVLFRLESGRHGTIALLVQSHDIPQWSRSEQIQRPRYLLKPVEEKVFEPRFRLGQVLQFRLVANPTIKRNGKRLALRKEEDQIAWLQRKAQENGFRVAQLQLVREGDIRGGRGRQMMTWHSVRFDGLLVVENVEAFTRAVVKGIGAAKGFGFGLLSVMRPVME